MLIVMNNGAVPPAAVAVMVAVEPGQLVAGGVIVQVGIGEPVNVVVLVQVQVVPAVLPVEESVISAEYVSVTPAPGVVVLNDRVVP